MAALLRAAALLLLSVALAACIAGPPARSASPGDPPDWAALGREAIDVLSRYLRIDTTNPPGNETPAARFLKDILDREGIEARVIEAVPGRGNVYARLRGDGTRPAVVLLNHVDVVPADRRYWSVDPFAGVIQDGYVWGRGALDMKGHGVVELMAMVALKRQGIPLKADVIFLGVADEEAGGQAGAGFLVERHWDLVKDAGVVLNEGGSIFRDALGRRRYGVSVSEKMPMNVKLIATGTPGHGSVPRAGSAVNRLVAALARIVAWHPPARVLPEVQAFYADLADAQPSPIRERLKDLGESLRDPEFATLFARRGPSDDARVRNTLSVTMLEGSNKINVIPAEATAQIDVRLLPGQDPEAFLAELRQVIADDSIKIEARPVRPAGSSPLTHPFLEVLGRVARARDPDARVTTPLLTAATDCRFFRPRGIACYGFAPFLLTARDFDGFHGNNERLSVENVVEGTRLMYDIVHGLAVD